MKLRDYQSKAVEAALRSLRNNPKNPCVVAPTGSGKSVIMAFIIKELLKTNPKIRILILAHVKELIVQNSNKLSIIDPELNIGIYSAGLGRKDIGKSITFATIASVWSAVKNGFGDSEIGHLDLIIVDEAHRINVKSEGMYHELISLYKSECNTKVLGLTATPFRTSTGSIIGDTNILNLICYDIQIPELITNGYISKPIIMSTKNHADMKNVSIKNGEFDAAEAGAAMLKTGAGAIGELIIKAKERQHIICFCCNIEHAEVINERLNKHGVKSMVLHSKLNNERDGIIKSFQNGEIRCLVNVNILTEGFDAPFIDCVVLMRATMSPGLYVQMVGRGFRPYENKENFLVLDFGENIERHGCIDDISTQPFEHKKTGCAPVKICPECQTATHISKRECPNCGHKYLFSENKKVTSFSSIQAILTAEIEPIDIEVRSVQYYPHEKFGKPKSMKVVYNTGNLGLVQYTEYICLYHGGYAEDKAREWWHDRTDVGVPMEIKKAVAIAKTFEAPYEITVKRDGKYWRITNYKFKNKPEKPLFYSTESIYDKIDEDGDVSF